MSGSCWRNRGPFDPKSPIAREWGCYSVMADLAASVSNIEKTSTSLGPIATAAAASDSTGPTGSVATDSTGPTGSVATDSTVTDSTVTDSTATDSTGPTGSTGTDSTGSDSTGSESTGSDSTGTDSTGTDSTGTDSTATGSTGTDSSATGSTATDSAATDSTGTDSTGPTGSTGTDSTVTDSAATDSAATDSTATGSTVTDSTVTDSTVTNSTGSDSDAIGSTAEPVAADSTAEPVAADSTAAELSRPESNCLAEGESSAGNEGTEDMIGFLDTIKERNHDTMPEKIGIIKSLTGEELRIILCKVDTKEYVNIRGTVLPYDELQGIFSDFEFMKETYAHIKKEDMRDTNICMAALLAIVFVNSIFFYVSTRF